jgi:hypothetical protein
VRSHAPWYLKALAITGVAAIVLAVVQVFLGAGRGGEVLDVSGMRSEAESLRQRVSALEAEFASVQQQADAAHSTLRIERSVQAQLTSRIRSLESENSRLREDMLVFESLAGASGVEQGFKINRLVIEPDGEAGRYRYRMLIVRQGGKLDRDALGSYEIVATIDQQGRGANIGFPSEKRNPAYRLAFRHFQRIDGVITVPEGATLKSIEVRFVQDGQIRARATAAD